MTMREPSQTTSSSTKIALFALLFLAIAAMAYWFNSREQSAQNTAAPAQVEATTAAAVPEVAPSATSEAEPEIDNASDAEAEPEETFGFDVVRVEPNGSALVAGFAPAGQDVLLMVDGVELVRGTADLSGKFVVLFDMPGAEEPRSLSLGVEDSQGDVALAKASVLIAPIRGADDTPEQIVEAEPELPVEEPQAASAEIEPVPEPETETEIAEAEIGEPELLAPETSVSDVVAQSSIDALTPVAPEQPVQPEISIVLASPQSPPSAVQSQLNVPLTDIEGETDPIVVATAPPVPQDRDEDVSASEAEPSEEDAVVAQTSDRARATVPQNTQTAPAVVLLNEEGVTVLQPAPLPQAPGREVVYNVVIDTISYDSTGDVNLTGRGAAGAFVRVYLDDRPLMEIEIGADGTWTTPLPGVDAGVYRLRIDELSAEGVVTSRIETPFQREQVSLAAGSSGAITVQPGFTLWAIAEANFGDGAQYVRVYEANRDLIRDPDLIYPGQVFQIPKDIQ